MKINLLPGLGISSLTNLHHRCTQNAKIERQKELVQCWFDFKKLSYRKLENLYKIWNERTEYYTF